MKATEEALEEKQKNDRSLPLARCVFLSNVSSLFHIVTTLATAHALHVISGEALVFPSPSD
ncbi:hypothetical protein Taro_023704 [Colocasia esculenta]|uniref:Uncharacterized protein n=1 Tax=Colocasia esculenta TaxID=4460 RepID=A0A843V4V5_COLES|nr:hypothetical protein [Colocasia esculenta]